MIISDDHFDFIILFDFTDYYFNKGIRGLNIIKYAQFFPVICFIGAFLKDDYWKISIIVKIKYILFLHFYKVIFLWFIIFTLTVKIM